MTSAPPHWKPIRKPIWEWYKIPFTTLLRVDRITSLAMQVLERHKEKFTTDFVQNKKLLDQIAIVRSKGLKNEIAGYITKFIKRENASKALKEEERAEEEVASDVDKVEEVEAQEISEESIPQEIIVESASEESS